MTVSVSRDCPNVGGTRYYLRNELQILYAHSWDRWEQKPIKSFRKSSCGRSQGLPKIFKLPIYRAHRAVIFVIAQLSCFLVELIRCGIAICYSLSFRWLACSHIDPVASIEWIGLRGTVHICLPGRHRVTRARHTGDADRKSSITVVRRDLIVSDEPKQSQVTITSNE